MSTMQQDIVEMKSACDQLSRLLSDPQPGITSWYRMTVESMVRLRDLLDEKLD